MEHIQSNMRKMWKEAQKEILHELQAELNTKGLAGVVEYCEKKFKELE